MASQNAFNSLNYPTDRVLLIVVMLILVKSTTAGVFEFAGDTRGVDVITHPTGYNGTGRKLIVTVGISPSSPHADSMEISHMI